MSVLLEALKKAALEKRDRSQSRVGVATESASKSASSPASVDLQLATSTPTPVNDFNSHHSTKDSESQIEMEFVGDAAGVEDWSDDVDFTLPEAKLNADELNADFLESGNDSENIRYNAEHPDGLIVQSQESTDELSIDDGAEASESVSPLNLPNDLLPSEQVVASQEVARSSESPTPPPEKEVAQPEFTSENSAFIVDDQPVQPASATEAEIKKQSEELEPNQNASDDEQDKIDEEDARTAQPASHPRSKNTKEAMAKLIENGNLRERKKKNRLIIATGLLILLAIIYASFYWYYIDQSQSGLLVKVPHNSNNRAADNPEQIIESSFVDVQSEVTPEQLQEPSSEPQSALPEVVQESNSQSVPSVRVESKATAPSDENASPTKNVTPPKTLVNSSNNAAVKAKRASTPQTPKTNIIRRNPEPDNLRRAYRLYTDGSYGEALELYRAAYKTSPRNIDVLLGVAASSQKLGNQQAALNFYQKVLQENPKNVTALAGMMSITAANANQPELESQLFNLLAQNPNHSHLHFLLGNMYFARTNWQGALNHFAVAVEAQPSNPDYLFNLAVTHDRLGQAQNALRFYQLALQLSSADQKSFSRAELARRIQTLSAISSAEDSKRKGN